MATTVYQVEPTSGSFGVPIPGGFYRVRHSEFIVLDLDDTDVVDAIEAIGCDTDNLLLSPQWIGEEEPVLGDIMVANPLGLS